MGPSVAVRSDEEPQEKTSSLIVAEYYISVPHACLLFHYLQDQRLVLATVLEICSIHYQHLLGLCAPHAVLILLIRYHF